MNMNGVVEKTKITRKVATEIIKEHLTDEQIDFILDDYFSDEDVTWLEGRLRYLKEYKSLNFEVVE